MHNQKVYPDGYFRWNGTCLGDTLPVNIERADGAIVLPVVNVGPVVLVPHAAESQSHYLPRRYIKNPMREKARRNENGRSLYINKIKPKNRQNAHCLKYLLHIEGSRT